MSSRILLATRLGPVPREVAAYATSHAMDLIVIGTHGRRGVTHALLGSVAEEVVRRASCPVLTVKPDATSTKVSDELDPGD